MGTECLSIDAIIISTQKCQKTTLKPNKHQHVLTALLHVYYLDEKHHKLDIGGGDPLVSRTSRTGEDKQEVPLGSQLCLEPSINTSEQHRGLFHKQI